MAAPNKASARPAARSPNSTTPIGTASCIFCAPAGYPFRKPTDALGEHIRRGGHRNYWSHFGARAVTVN
jgi:hypothetical protein